MQRSPAGKRHQREIESNVRELPQVADRTQEREREPLPGRSHTTRTRRNGRHRIAGPIVDGHDGHRSTHMSRTPAQLQSEDTERHSHHISQRGGSGRRSLQRHGPIFLAERSEPRHQLRVRRKAMTTQSKSTRSTRSSRSRLKHGPSSFG